MPDAPKYAHEPHPVTPEALDAIRARWRGRYKYGKCSAVADVGTLLKALGVSLDEAAPTPPHPAPAVGVRRPRSLEASLAGGSREREDVMLLVSGSTRSVGRLAEAHPNHLGHLITPNNGNSIASLLRTGLSWAVDNGAFSGFDAARFRRLLGRVAGQPRLLWIVCPDVVADAHATLGRFDEWHEEVSQAGPVAFVGQDGAERMQLPWARFQCLFLGGSTDWKLSKAAQDLAHEAKRRRKWLHLGRVNSRRRLRYAWSMRADSTDGTACSRFGETYIAKYLRWQREMIPWP